MEHSLENNFKKAYAGLNAAQKKAVDAIEGPVMVIAGPGTGKTQILTLRIANILLKTDTRPENILALTFTESGAKAMRERLHRYIGAAAYKVGIFTFHGFASRLISDFPDAYTRVIGGTPASDLHKIDILQQILATPDIKLLSPMGNKEYYIVPILRILSDLKKEYITPDGFAEIIVKQENDLLGIEQFHTKGAHTGKVRSEFSKKEATIAKNKELLFVYRNYEAMLQSRKLYDYEDMIIETVEALQHNERMLRELQETYQYVLADEHQDVNGSQNKILELLCSFHDHPNIFVVGDEKQAIYRFQGASLENFLYFEDVFKDTLTIALTENYRSGQRILDAAHSLVAVEDGPLKDLRVPLRAGAVSESQVSVRHFSHQSVEDGWVIEEIQSCLARGIAPQEIAVIVRTNKEVEQFAELLRKEKIEVTASADGDILNHPITTTICSFIDALVKPQDESALFTLLHGVFWGIPVADCIKIAKGRSYNRPLIEILKSQETLVELGVQEIEKAQAIAMVFEDARNKSATESPHRVLEAMLIESGFLHHVLTTNPLEGGRVVRRVYDEIEEMVKKNAAATLSDVSGVLALHRTHHVPLNAPYIASSASAVTVLTAHKSKGLEFTAVFVPHLADSIWGGSVRRTYFDIPLTKHISADAFDPVDDEERLLYVALTRAKTYLSLSHADTNADGRELLVSRLLESIDGQFLAIHDTQEAEASFDPLLSLTKKVPQQAIDPSLFRMHLQEKGLSATALNNYLQSPWDYVYRNVLRVPEVQPLTLQYGTAIHGVMEWVSGVLAQSGTLPNATKIKAALERELSKLPMNHDEFTKLHEKGFAALLSYQEHLAQHMPRASKVEASFHVRMPTGISDFPEVELTGKLDRLDFDPEGNVIQVVDYKTGKPKTRNEIEGNTKNSDGNYKRQLTFYALLLSLMDDTRYACTTGVLSFIEPDAKGKIHEEIFEITEAEIAALKDEISRVVREIISGAFLTEPCDESSSSYCHLASALMRNI